MAFNLADRPVVGPVKAMQVVDLFGRKHGLDPHLYAQGIGGTRAMFFTRIRREGDNPLKHHDFGGKLRCSLQDRPHLAQPAKPLPGP
jgi:hypothetical protein